MNNIFDYIGECLFILDFLLYFFINCKSFVGTELAQNSYNCVYLMHGRVLDNMKLSFPSSLYPCNSLLERFAVSLWNGRVSFMRSQLDETSATLLK